jgi:predicted RNA-binding protein YlxR (DUF448 family)
MAEREDIGGGRARERSCAVTRAVKAPHELIRFVVGPDGTLTPDIKGKLPGRGAWVTCSRTVLDEAIRRKAFARSLKVDLRVPDGLADLVDRLLAADARQSLSLANKAGLVVTGFAKVEAALGKGRVAAMVSASDGSEDGRRKLRQAASRAGLDVPAITHLSGGDLDLALGRENAIHAALLAGPASDAFLARCARLAAFRLGASGEAGPGAETNSASTGPFVLENN